MRIFSGLDHTFDPSDGCVLAVGNFDGVHKGHQLIFKTAVLRARDEGSKAVLLTFTRHPAAITRPGETPHPLMTISDRLQIAESFGFDAAIVIEFDRRMAALSPDVFIEDILVSRLGVKAVVAGESWRFGSGRKGDMAMLDSFGQRLGFRTCVIDPFVVDDLPVSSTRIRKALAAGDVNGAAALLGRPHFVRGTVVSGRGRGRLLGYPTVNLDCHQILVPGDGVYAGGYRMGEKSDRMDPDSRNLPEAVQSAQGPAAISIGSSPTFENGSFAVEAHLVGWENDLYGADVTIVFFDRLRNQHTFAGAVDLARHIARDVDKTRKLFSIRKMEEIPP